MFTDMVGYTSLSQKNEALAMELLEEHRKLVRPFFPKHNGREVKTIGDAFLVEFASALEAVRCAFDIQQALHEMNSGRSADKKILLRIGVHLVDVIHSQDDVYGDAVNVASRIEPLASPGGICVTEQIYNPVRNKFEFPFTTLGKTDLKNVDEKIEVYRMILPWEECTSQEKPSANIDSRRIAILPFANFSPDPNDEYFADGITEEIISTVSQITGLSVISRTSVMGYKGTTKKMREIGKELEVGSVLEGSIRKAENKIRVTTQLVDVAADRHLWAQSYNDELNDVFAIQSDIAQSVARSMKVVLLEKEKVRMEKAPTKNMSAYESYLKGMYLVHKGTLRAIEDSMKQFEDAITLDPDFSLACAALGNVHVLLAGETIPPRPAFEKAKPLIAKAHWH
jgi:adenylate cyclase